MALKYVTTEKVPVWALCYLEYGDMNGIEEEEKFEIDEWLEENLPRGFVLNILNIDASYFTNCPLWGKACDVVDVEFYEP